MKIFDENRENLTFGVLLFDFYLEIAEFVIPILRFMGIQFLDLAKIKL